MNSQCNLWANQGSCGSNPKYMVRECAFSCKQWELGELEPPSNIRIEGDYRDIYEPTGVITDSLHERGGSRRRMVKKQENIARGRRHGEYLDDSLVYGQCYGKNGEPEAECSFKAESCPSQVSSERCGVCPLWATGELPKCYGGQCIACPRGAVCFGGASWPRIAPGYWSPNVWKIKDGRPGGFGSGYECTPSAACMGDDGFGTPVCAEGYEQGITNTLCVQCETDPKNRHYKEPGTGRCLKCPDNQWMFGAAFMCFGLCVIIFGFIPGMYFMLGKLMGLEMAIPRIWKCSCVFFGVCCLPVFMLMKLLYLGGQKMMKGAQQAAAATTCCSWDDKLYDVAEWAETKTREAPVLRALAMGMNYSQTLYAFAMLQQIGWPAESWFLLSWTKLITLDIEFFKPDCIVPLPYFTKWIGKLLMPYVAVLILIMTTAYAARDINKEQRKKLERGEISEVKHLSMWKGFFFTLGLVIHILNIFHLKVVLSPVDCNWCR